MRFFLSLCALAGLAAGAPILSTGGALKAVTSSLGLSFYSDSLEAGAPLGAASTYTCYSGGAANFPGPEKWASFSQLWDFQVTNSLRPIGNSAEEIQNIHDAIVQVSGEAKVDARVILAMVIKESTGNVRVPCTNNGVENCGLMQSFNAEVKNYDPANSRASILQMIRDGVQGTAAGPGLVQNLATTNGNLWEALRTYNSGSCDASNLSNGLGATANYVSHIANFLQGWQGWGSPNVNSCGW